MNLKSCIEGVKVAAHMNVDVPTSSSSPKSCAHRSHAARNPRHVRHTHKLHQENNPSNVNYKSDSDTMGERQQTLSMFKSLINDSVCASILHMLTSLDNNLLNASKAKKMWDEVTHAVIERELSSKSSTQNSLTPEEALKNSSLAQFLGSASMRTAVNIVLQYARAKAVEAVQYVKGM